MCLLIPPKPKKANKPKALPKPAPMPPIPRYSRMPARPCCAPSSLAPYRTDEEYIDYLQQQCPDNQSELHQYTTQLGLHRIDDNIHGHADKNYQATETVGKGVKNIQERLEKMEESLRVTGEAADAIWDFCDDENYRIREKDEAKRQEKEDATKREIERLKALLEEKKIVQDGEKKGLGEAEVLKLLAERDMRLELDRLRLKEHGTTEKTRDDLFSEAQLQNILDQRQQAKELQRLQAQQRGAPKFWLDTPDLVDFLENRDDDKHREADLARPHKSATKKPSKHEESETQEQVFRRMLDDHEQRRELERLRTFEAEALKQRKAKDQENLTAAALPRLAEVERHIEDILEKHDRQRHQERSRETLRGRRHSSPRALDEDLHQTAIDEILSLLLRQRSAGRAADVLDTILRRPANAAHVRHDARESDRQWILTEVLRYLDTSPVDRVRDSDRSEPYAHQNPGYHNAYPYSCAPPPSFQSPRSSNTDSTGARRWSPEQPHVRFAAKSAVPAYWERASYPENDRR